MTEMYLGLDLCRKNLQISYFREDRGEPESIYQLNNTETYQLPNVMFFDTDENKWYVGNNVSTVRFQKNGKIIEDVYGNVGTDNQVVLNGETYSYDKEAVKRVFPKKGKGGCKGCKNGEKTDKDILAEVDDEYKAELEALMKE